MGGLDLQIFFINKGKEEVGKYDLESLQPDDDDDEEEEDNTHTRRLSMKTKKHTTTKRPPPSPPPLPPPRRLVVVMVGRTPKERVSFLLYNDKKWLRLPRSS